MTMIQPRVPEFPEHPEDGFQIKEELPNGGYAIWTYRKQFNEWTCQVYTGEIPGYVTTRQVLTVGPSVLADGSQSSILETQEQVNNTIASAALKLQLRHQVGPLIRSTSCRTALARAPGAMSSARKESPQDGEFWTQSNEIDFALITRITVNDVKAIDSESDTTNPGTLRDTRIGDYLTIQERGTNDFGMYVVEQTAVQVIGEQTIREFGLRLFANRAMGSTIVNSSRCQITTSRPVYTVVQDDEPVVSTRGVLWYRESDDDVLSISNYASGLTGTDGPQWTEINGPGGPGGLCANPDDYLKLGDWRHDDGLDR